MNPEPRRIEKVKASYAVVALQDFEGFQARGPGNVSLVLGLVGILRCS